MSERKNIAKKNENIEKIINDDQVDKEIDTSVIQDLYYGFLKTHIIKITIATLLLSILFTWYNTKAFNSSNYVFEFEGDNGLKQRTVLPIPSVEDVNKHELINAKLKHYSFRQLYSGMENAMRFLGKTCSTMHDYSHTGVSKKIMALMVNDGLDFIPMINPIIVGNSTERVTRTISSPYCKNRGDISVVYYKFIFVRFLLYRDFVSMTVKNNLERCDPSTENCFQTRVETNGKTRIIDKSKKIDQTLNKYYVPSNQNKFFNELNKKNDKHHDPKKKFIEMTLMFDDKYATCIQKIMNEYVHGKTICG